MLPPLAPPFFLSLLLHLHVLSPHFANIVVTDATAADTDGAGFHRGGTITLELPPLGIFYTVQNVVELVLHDARVYEKTNCGSFQDEREARVDRDLAKTSDHSCVVEETDS